MILSMLYRQKTNEDVPAPFFPGTVTTTSERYSKKTANVKKNCPLPSEIMKKRIAFLSIEA
ncbi:hypothetical protein ASB62_06530 [Chlorobium limicola]|uniref:Uncharacterized protein n=1 Tax=Chlorobium limicola TaxID=1092 RepID=A0A101JF43_CHLLI|nr:hypothetical protein ASB62_06530 [Chlorobium limicola]